MLWQCSVRNEQIIEDYDRLTRYCEEIGGFLNIVYPLRGFLRHGVLKIEDNILREIGTLRYLESKNCSRYVLNGF